MPTPPSQSLLRLRTGTALAFSVMATVMFAFGCVKTVPDFPQQTEVGRMQLGVLAVRPAESLPTVYYQKPPSGFVDGLLRGSKHGAILGTHVGLELAQAFLTRAPEMTRDCERTNQRGGCGHFILIAPILSFLALTATPPFVTTVAGIQGGFTALSTSQTAEWEQALNEAHEQLHIQATMTDHLRRTLSTCCLHRASPTARIATPIGEGVPTGLDRPDTILETDVLELGLAEATAGELPQPDENNRAIDPTMAKATVPLNAIFDKANSSLYLIVRARLLRGSDNSLIAERQFGYLSTPLPYTDWANDNATRFRTELSSAYQSLAGQIAEKLVTPSF